MTENEVKFAAIAAYYYNKFLRDSDYPIDDSIIDVMEMAEFDYSDDDLDTVFECIEESFS